MSDRAPMKAAEQARRIVDLWQERPRWQRTAEHLLPFYGWLLEREPAVIPEGPGSILKVSTILAAYLIYQSLYRPAVGHVAGTGEDLHSRPGQRSASPLQ